MRPLRDSWALSSPNPVAVPPASPFPGRQPLVPVSSFPLQLVIPLSSACPLLTQGGFRGVDPSPVALPEHFGSTSTSLTESSLLLLLEQNCLTVFTVLLIGPQPPLQSSHFSVAAQS